MSRNHFSQQKKDEAIRLFFEGVSSIEIAKRLKISSPDLVRKWAQFKRKELGLPANYRAPSALEDESEIFRLMGINARLESERNLLLKTLALVMNGKIKEWEELKSYFIKTAPK